MSDKDVNVFTWAAILFLTASLAQDSIASAVAFIALAAAMKTLIMRYP